MHAKNAEKLARTKFGNETVDKVKSQSTELFNKLAIILDQYNYTVISNALLNILIRLSSDLSEEDFNVFLIALESTKDTAIALRKDKGDNCL